MIKRINIKSWIKHNLLTSFFLVLVSCGQGMNEQQMLQNARIYLDKNDLMAASIELRNTLQKNNENAEAHYLLGSVSLEAGDLTSAEKEFKRAALAGWNEEQTQLGLARVLITRKEFQKLLDEIVIVNTWTPVTHSNISALRAMAEAGLGRIPQAKITLDEARATKADAFQVLKTTVMFQLSGIQDGDASNTLQTALSLYPNNAELMLLDASNDSYSNNPSHAADTFRKIISLEPANLITPNGRRARIGLARLQIIEKKYDESNATLAPLLKKNDKDPEANYLAGLLTFSQGDYNRAENHARKLLAMAADNSASQLLMGKIKFALKDYHQTAFHLSAYLKTNPDDITVRKLLTNTYLFLNEPEQARTTLQPLLSLNSDDAGTLTLLSQIKFSEGNVNAGILALRKAIKSSPDNIALHRQMAKVYIAKGETDLALIELEIFQDLSKDTEETRKLAISAYIQAGEVNKAINIANEMLIKKPQDPEILSLNGALQSANDNNQQARLYFNKALELQNNLPSATIGLARIERKEGNVDKAITLYNGLVKSNKGSTLPMLGLAELAAQQKRTNDMLFWLERARNTAPGETMSRVILANYYLRNNQPKQSDIYIQEAITISPEQTELLALQGKSLIAQKRYSEALLPLNKLVDKSPTSADAQVMLGEVFLRQGMTERARDHLQQALNTQENHFLALSLMAETEFKAGKYDKSLAYAINLQKIQPQHYIGYMQEGDVWMAKKHYNRALSVYNNAWKQQQTAELAIRLFSASNHSMNLEDAIQPLLSWLGNHPNDSSTRFFLATTYQTANKNDDAIEEYEKVLEETPDNSATLNNLAWLYSLKDDSKALGLAERAYRTTPDNPGILDTYGWILVQQGQLEKGQRLIKQAMELLPDNLEIRYHYATALFKSGNEKDGRQLLEKLLEQGKPFNGRNEAQQLLEKQEHF